VCAGFVFCRAILADSNGLSWSGVRLVGAERFFLFFTASLSVPPVLVIAALDSHSASVCGAVAGSISPVPLRSGFPLQNPVLRQ
jgi:hypothetical protein